MDSCPVLLGLFGLVLVRTVLQPSLAQAVTFTRTPHNPTIVMDGVNSSRVSLIWRYALDKGEQLRSVTIESARPGEKGRTRIATRPSANGTFVFARNRFRLYYGARPPATLVLKDVKTTGENTYTLGIFYYNGIRNGKLENSVSVVVFAPPRITTSPVRKADIEVGKDLTLTCNASGDPHPNITWTKDGVPVNQFNVSGPLLHLVNVQRKDAGSYRCTASNGYGDDATSVSIVNIKFALSVPPSITVTPLRMADIEVGNDLTLTCYASGDPKPTIIWTKDSMPVEKFNASGHFFHLVNAHRKDAGSYRCTASNGYGNNVTSVSIISIKCGNKCKTERVGITLTNEKWNQSLSNRESTVFKTLESAVLMAIWNVYGQNSRKELYKVSVEEFRPGSVVAIVKLLFGKSANDPLTPLQDEITDGRLGSFRANSTLDVDPSDLPLQTTNFTKNESEDDSWTKEIKLHAIYSSVIGFLVIINVMAIMLYRRRNDQGSSNNTSCRYNGKNKENVQDQTAPLQVSEAYVNLADGLMLSDEESTIAQSPPLESTSLNKTHQTISEYMSPNPAKKLKNWEVSREHVEISKVIGKGAFCQVAKATVMNINGVKGRKTVAVKMLKENAPKTDKKDLLSELELLKILKPHPHVIKLIGCVTESEPLLVLIEYIPYGDLLGYLRKSRGLNDTYFKDPDVKPQTNLTSQQLIQFAWQIADGMSYLCSSKIIHRDLAARNVLVGEGEKCKVTDFGMARNVHQDDIYTKQSRGRLPVKWTAYEGLLYGTYTTQSDVWSFGVVLYEIFTVGGSPYPGINPREIANKLQKGYRMPKPKHVDDQLYQIMLQCWQENPNDRPTFSKLKDTITRMAQSNNETYVNMKEYDTNLYANVDDLSME
ncbi:hypothetical protein ACROYT_G028409 [Oculina patagonica]